MDAPPSSEYADEPDTEEIALGAGAKVPSTAGGGRRLLLLALVAIAILAGSLATWQFSTGEPSTGPTPNPVASGPTAAGPSVTPSVPPPASAAPPTTGGPAAPVIPDGFRLYRDPSGFSLAVPVGWQRSQDRHIVTFREPNGARFLLIDQTDSPKSDAVADWTRQEAARRNRFRDYRRIRIERRENYFQEAADWEFTYTGPSGGRQHVINLGFVTGPNRAYGLYWSTPDAQWEESLRYFEVFTSTFKPAAS
ncbi:MAG TPA: hypothetical protein VGR21_06935 [Cryptosporangiaceae bacterium]|nr:hypothetical protein [Cryptosporangiaceae bacterium]